MDLEEVKRYLKVDGDEEDEEVKTLVSAAQEYLQNAGIPP